MISQDVLNTILTVFVPAIVAVAGIEGGTKVI